MKKAILLCFLLIIILSGVQAQNLVRNPSFEEGSGNIAYYWFSVPSDPRVVFKREYGISHTGNYSVSTEKNNSELHAVWGQIVNLENNKYYKISSYAKARAGELNIVTLIFFWKNGQQQSLPNKVWANFAGSSIWSRFEYIFFVPEDTDSITIALEFLGPTGKAYFDDVNIRELDLKQEGIVAFNCGAENPFLESPDGIKYLPDLPYSSQNSAGYIKSSKPPGKEFGFDLIGGTENRYDIYREARYGFSEFRFDLENGCYAVQLHFCENEFHWKNKRIENFKIEGEPVLSNFDIYKEAGRSYVTVHRFLADLKDGHLNIEAEANPGKTMLSAISVVKVEPDEVPPQKPAELSIIDGFSELILNWKPNFEHDFKNFKVYRKPGSGSFELIGISNTSRYIDLAVEIGKPYTYQITSVDLWGNESEPSRLVTASPVGDEASNLTVYELIISEEMLAKLNEDIWSDEYVDAAFIHNGEVWENVGVRYRGNITQKFSKKNYKIRFNPDEMFNGSEKLNLNASMSDFSMLVDEMTYSLRRDAGILTQDTYPVHLKINGKFIGVYISREQEDNEFLANHGIGDANIYRSQRGNMSKLPNIEEYERAYEKENNTATGYDDLIEFIEFINETPDEEFKDEIPLRFNIGEFLTASAVLNCVADIDQAFHNFLLFRSFRDGTWRTSNWDHNATFGKATTPVDLNTLERPSPIGQSVNYLFNKMFHIDDFRYYYITKLLELTNGLFSPAAMQNRITNFYNLIKYDVHRDIYKQGWEENWLFDAGPQHRINFVNQRVPYIQREAPKFLPSGFDKFSGIFINEICANNSSTLKNDNGEFSPWIELYNNGVIPVELAGCCLTNDMQNTKLWEFPGGSIIEPKKYLIIWADGEQSAGEIHASFILNRDGGELGLFSPEGRLLDSLTYGKQDEDVSFGRNEDGGLPWKVFDTPTPNESNTKDTDIAELVINEFMADNESFYSDEKGDFDDWIELYNPMGKIADIGGYYMTDDISAPVKWQIPPGVRIQAKGFILFWADKDPGQGSLHISSFKLSKDGEQIGLFARDGRTVIDTITFGQQQTDVSMGRNGDANPEWIFFTVPTPLATNLITSIEDVSGAGNNQLSQNYPNPFHISTIISFSLDKAGSVSLKIYDALGAELETLIENRFMQAGEYQIKFNANNLPSGIYYYRLRGTNFLETKSFFIIK